jgi:hypothetical protein
MHGYHIDPIALDEGSSATTNRSRQPAPVYKVHDRVWLNLRNVRSKRSSKKIDWLHPKYEVLEVPTPYTVRLNVPTSVHPVFHVDLVRLAATDPLPSQVVDDSEPPPVMVEGELEYEVEAILDMRRRRRGSRSRKEALEVDGRSGAFMGTFERGPRGLSS